MTIQVFSFYENDYLFHTSSERKEPTNTPDGTKELNQSLLTKIKDNKLLPENRVPVVSFLFIKNKNSAGSKIIGKHLNIDEKQIKEVPLLLQAQEDEAPIAVLYEEIHEIAQEKVEENITFDFCTVSSHLENVNFFYLIAAQMIPKNVELRLFNTKGELLNRIQGTGFIDKNYRETSFKLIAQMQEAEALGFNKFTAVMPSALSRIPFKSPKAAAASTMPSTYTPTLFKPSPMPPPQPSLLPKEVDDTPTLSPPPMPKAQIPLKSSIFTKAADAMRSLFRSSSSSNMTAVLTSPASPH